MIVLHACWSDGSLHVWGERPPEAHASRADRAPGAQPLPHPFSLAPDALRAALALAGADVASLALGADDAVTLALPSVHGAPAPSARLAHLTGWSPNGESPALVAWRAPSVRLRGGAGADLLDRLAAASDELADAETGADEEIDYEASGAAPRARAGAHADAPALAESVRWFAVAGRFARALLADQRFVAALDQPPGGDAEARWRPWLGDDAIRGRVEALAGAMPPAARAAVDALAHDRGLALEAYLGAVVDDRARAVLVRDGMREALDGRSAADPAVAWLAGLLDESARVELAAETRTAALRGARQWIAVLEDRGGGSAWRLLLTLREPAPAALPDAGARIAPAGDAPWSLEFGLVAADESGARIDAAEIWALRSSAVIQGARLDDPHETLLAELARAARLYAPLESALEETRPASLTLAAAEAYDFLKEHAPILLEQGVAVDRPEWWDSPASRLGIRLHIDSESLESLAPGRAGASAPGPASAAVGLDALVGYRWRVAVGDLTLSMEEFQSLAAQRAPLVRVAGQWVEIRREDVQAAVKFLRDNPGGKASVSEVLRLASSWETERAGLPIVGLDATGWVAGLLGRTDEAMTMVSQPEGLHGELRPYQVRGLSWLAFLDRFGLGACLADDMGLGKTVQLLALLARERETLKAAGHAGGPTLIVVPMSVVENWVREARRFTPDVRIMVHHGPERPIGEAFARRAREADAVLTTYALAHRDRDSLMLVEWRRVALDEAQNVKNPSAKQSQAVRDLRAPRRVALTGTPVENRLAELWSIMDFCNPGLLGSHGEFRRRFAAPIERTRDRARAGQLRALVQPFILRRLKTDPLVTADLPPKVETKAYCRLSAEQAALYDAAVKRMLAAADRAEGIERRGVVLAGLVRLKQICNHPAHLLKDHDFDGAKPPLAERSGKCARLLEMLEEVVAEGDSALVFTQFRQMGRLLQAMLAHHLDREILFLHGGSPAPQRQKMIDRFQQRDGRTPIFLLSLKAGGVGLNLTAASHVFHFDRWWNPAVENQATDRAHRIGQTRTVQVHKFVVSGTLEERIDEMIESKVELAEQIVGAGEAWLTELSTSALRDLLTRGADALSDDADEPAALSDDRAAAALGALAVEPETEEVDA